MTPAVLLALAILSASETPVGSAAAAGAAPAERYRFNLGGPSGEFTNWERQDLARFDGLRTTIRIDQLRGKPSDKWAALTRVNLFGAGDDKERPMLSLLLHYDRKTHRPLALIQQGRNAEQARFDVDLPPDQPVTITIVPGASGELAVSFNANTFKVPCDFEVKSISVVASGADAHFEPFELLRTK